MRLVLIVLAFIAGLVATVVGFGFVHDAGWTEDWPGWVSLSLTLFVLAHFPWERFTDRA